MGTELITDSSINKYLEDQKFSSDKIGRVKYSRAEINNMPLFPNQFLYVTNVDNGIITNIRGVINNLGYSDEEFSRADFLFEIIHDKDKPYIFEAAKTAYEFGLRNIIKEKLLDSVFSLNYRVVKKSGDYINIMRQTSFLELDINDKVISMFSVCTDVSHINPNNYIGWRIDGYNNLNFDLSHMFNNMFDKKTENFSKKEVQIIKELSLGLQSKEIGEKLFISKHTVDTHRRNILKKTGLSNTVELIIYAIRSGIV